MLHEAEQTVQSDRTAREKPENLCVTGLGVGVHRTRFKSLSLLFSQPAALPIASPLLDAAVPIVVRSSSLLAAGISEPDASARRGVHDGGGMSPFLRA
jgi:hypothetical protein